jgi:hypothetical protein
MARTPAEIAAKAKEIFDEARQSDWPMNVLSLQSTILLGKPDWLPADVERVSGGVVELLVKHGWKRQP